MAVIGTFFQDGPPLLAPRTMLVGAYFQDGFT